MYLCVTVLAAVIVALARGGEWQNLIAFRFKSSWFVLISIATQFIIFNPWWNSQVDSVFLTNSLYMFSILMLVLFVVVNWTVSGLKTLGLGIISNGIAIIANGGNMPSSLEALKKIMSPEAISKLQSGQASYNIILITEETRLKLLCDIFYVPGVNVYSIGDILIALGAFVTIQHMFLGRGLKKQNLQRKGGY